MDVNRHASDVIPDAEEDVTDGESVARHDDVDPELDREACIRGKIWNTRKYSAAFSRPIKVYGEINTMDPLAGCP